MENRPQYAEADAAYLDALYAAIDGRAQFVSTASGPGFVDRHIPVTVLGIDPPTGKQRKPQVTWRWSDEERTHHCSVASFRRCTRLIDGEEWLA